VRDRSAGTVVGHGTQALRLLQDPIGRHIEELGARVNEAAHQPGAGDAVDLGPLARDPARGPFSRHTEVGALAQGGQAAFDESFDAALKISGLPASAAQIGGGLLAHFLPVHATGDGAPGLAGGGKTRHVLWGAADCAGAMRSLSKKRSSPRTSRTSGASALPNRATNCSGEMEIESVSTRNSRLKLPALGRDTVYL